jgi:hypothetical protein
LELGEQFLMLGSASEQWDSFARVIKLDLMEFPGHLLWDLDAAGAEKSLYRRAFLAV